MSLALSCRVALFLAVFCSSCGTQHEVQKLSEQVAVLRRELFNLAGVVRLHDGLNEQFKGELNWLGDQTEACKYRQYGTALHEACATGRCEVGTLAKPLQHLKAMHDSYVVLHVRASAGQPTLTGGQKLEVMRMLLRGVRKPTSRLLLIALPPRGESATDLEQAQRTATATQESIEKALGTARDFRWFPPTAVGCNALTRSLFDSLKTEYASYLAREFKTSPERIPGPTVMVVLFRLDCLGDPGAPWGQP